MGKTVIRKATQDDVVMVKKIANRFRKELPYVMIPALRDAVERGELLVEASHDPDRIFGFVNYRTRRDGWHVIYEIAVDKPFLNCGIGRDLIEAVPRPIRLKCPVDNKANGFYRHLGFECVSTEQGAKRQLHVWELR